MIITGTRTMQQYEKAVLCFSWREISAEGVGSTPGGRRSACNYDTDYQSDDGERIDERYYVDYESTIFELDEFIPESEGRGQHNNIFTNLGGKLSGSKWMVLQDPHGSQKLQFSCR